MFIETIAQNYYDPFLAKSWGELRCIKDLQIVAKSLRLTIVLPFPAAKIKTQLLENFSSYMTQQLPDYNLEIDLTWQIETHAFQAGVAAIPQVKNVIAVASGKGGVGKSTTAVNLALSLLAQGARVGLLDADIYGPNQPHMLGMTKRLTPENGQPMQPVLAHGLQSMSIGYLIDPATPMVWRGPMVSSALQQLARETLWDNLDYLIIDLPPGTGDIQLTLAQKIPLNGVVIVTTPQEIALLDARKGIEMFRKVNVAILGIIENMSSHICSQCGHQEAIFGIQGADQLATAYDLQLLGRLPLAKAIREQADSGQPFVSANPQSDITANYEDMARKIAFKLALMPKNKTAKFPKIVTEPAAR